ncbi:hypothetical protein SEA_TAQUITO_91 [Mycobacterium phage Taquito]|uniref:Uncharacterized protein n=1 Tax=Mycobacterium phage Taquito TaxID=1897500 RepID=A0A1D8EQA6_9CAUD|nr:hypothetical protein I5G70_gp42 [Mycobacterium phage Taquito]AOT23211.1 hypothetical protein SEA_TAQUITO_91 [Mycobacterium phage Taquito]
MNTTATWAKDEAKAADAKLAELTEARYAAGARYDRALDAMHHEAGDKKRWLSRSVSVWGMSTDEAREKALDVAAGSEDKPWLREPARKAVEAFDQAAAELRAAQDAINEHEAANYKGWPRFFLVPDGHIHRWTGCSSLRPTTRIGWLPELSGETEAEAVEAHGAMLCTKCFPSAPVEWTRGKAPAADQCPGSGTWDYPRETARMGYAAGNYGVCSHCGERVTITSTGKMRKHKTK